MAEETMPYGPTPTLQQLRWQQMEMYAFLHFSINTYTDQEWGFGNEDASLFNPTDLDVKQWVTTCKNAGMKGIILTAKHHCGFCLWPSAYTDYSVKNSPWKDGKGDVVRELSDECHRQGLKFGVYLSPWDRHHPQYGHKEYITYFRNQLHELLTNYGDIFEVWFDGANGGDGWYGGANEKRKIDRTTYYEWAETYRLVRQWQPDICIWNDGGDRADLRWVGTEAGYVGETNWSLLDSLGQVGLDMLHHGKENGNKWVPGEVDTSIRPGWFYHTNEDSKVKSVDTLLETYYKSVGRNANLLLNFPIMPNGRINAIDSLNAAQFYHTLQKTFAINLAEKAKVKTEFPKENADNNGSVTLLKFNKSTSFNRVLIQEDIAKGQRVQQFSIEALVDGKWQTLDDQLSQQPASLTTIGYKRIICFPQVSASQLRITVIRAKAKPIINTIGVFLAP